MLFGTPFFFKRLKGYVEAQWACQGEVYWKVFARNSKETCTEFIDQLLNPWLSEDSIP